MYVRLAVAMLSAALGGCTFSRTVQNGHVRQMDTSWIRPGETTREDVVQRLGYPPSVTGSKGERGCAGGALGLLMGQSGGVPTVGMAAEGESDGAAERTFRWTCLDSDTKMFEGGWLFYPTFSKRLQRRGHDIYILFDGRGVVTLLSRTELVDGQVRILEWKELPK